MRRGIIAAAAFLPGLAGLWAASPAQAACYEDVGCTDSAMFRAGDLRRLASCEVLWEMRNGIYKENGYCFSTPRGIRAFGNAGCRFDDQASVPLNAYEGANVSTIANVERAKSCPR